MSHSVTPGATSGKKLLEEALAFARHGDVDGAVALLDKADLNEQVASILFMLLTAKRRHDEALVLIERTIAVVATDLARSTWTLRHGLLLLELERLEEARKVLLAVLKLKASEDHVMQAQASLLQTIKR